MYKDKEIIYIKALTPVHAGAGDGLESVDMPIQREKHSNIPKIEASSLKGSIKHSLYNKFKSNDNTIHDNLKKDLYTIFGPEYGEDYSSAIGFTDAKLLFFPVKSATDIFKLATCPYIIKRWIEDLKFQNEKFTVDLNINVNSAEYINNTEEEKIILEEYIFEKSASSMNINLQNLFKTINDLDTNRIVILNDSDFIDLVTMYTEIITRNKISVNTGAAEGTGLFTEEYLPAETIMYFMVLGAPSFNENNKKTSEDILNYFNNTVDEVFQVGGDATIGKGFVKRLGKVGDKDVKSKEC
ncbi:MULTISPECIES: type III-B CRISPR module RAMP protein Cmr4 [Clostridium]|uniref:type III-B CRISPR module RAMP protein Cmr4 n=1 Tax=Clostridium TaxID=1485 RepID=UPI00069DA7BF|nr:MULTISPECIES: type III-B CRISPR module RAMP protein Cmr4 [Clostridium]KOF58271.1 hypothetical protein AGR56_00130 [Clostridium sp. DMHC 10]MCD2348053.1 type III-B CRISPR module RAMP protein Cmr4 [Clostridium guangxiense]